MEKRNDKLAKYIDSNKDSLFNLLKKCVSIPTENPPGDKYKEMADIFRNELRSCGFKSRVIKVPNKKTKDHLGTSLYPRYITLGRWKTDSKKTFHFNGHYDVVAPSVKKWKIPPYSPQIIDNWLFGRGAGDMKGAITAFMFAAKAVYECGIKPKTNIEISCTPDEEIGGELGAGYLCKSGLINPDYVVIGEGGKYDEVGYGHRGAVWFEVSVIGKSAHAMLPDNGINAFEKMSQLVVNLKKDTDKILKQKQKIYKTEGGFVIKPTLTMGGQFFGVPKAIINTIPEQATFTLDRRTTPSENVNQAEREMKNLIKLAAKKVSAKITIKTIHKVKPTILKTDNNLFRTISESIKEIKKVEVNPSIGRGFNDLFHFASNFKIQGCCYGVIGRNMHGLDEKIDLKDLLKTTKVYANLISRLKS